MKSVNVRFNNIWDDYGDCDNYEIIIFSMPKEINIDIQWEKNILNACYRILNDYDLTIPEELKNALEEYNIYNVTEDDLQIAKEVLDNGNSGLIASRIAEFISKKYDNVTWKTLSYDLEINID